MKFLEAYNSMILNEDPDDLFKQRGAVAFIIWKSEKQFLSQFGIENLKQWKIEKKKYKVKFPLVIGIRNEDLYFNNNKINYDVDGPTHGSIIQAVFGIFPESGFGGFIYERGAGVAAGRVSSNGAMMSFWGHRNIDDKLIDDIIKNTKKYIKWDKKNLKYEIAPNAAAGLYGKKGIVSKYGKGVIKYGYIDDENDNPTIDAVRDRMFGTNIYEGKQYGFKKEVSIPNTFDLKYGSVSAWYLPKEDTIIYFKYAGHSSFMIYYWPSYEYVGKQRIPGRISSADRKIIKPEKRSPGLKPIIKKYSKSVISWLKKEVELYPRYTTFYDLGWVRINLQTHNATITHPKNLQNKDNIIKKLLLWIKDIDPGIDKAEVEQVGGSSKVIKGKDIGMGGASDSGDNIDAVRDRMFGTNIYSSVSFTELYNIILESL